MTTKTFTASMTYILIVCSVLCFSGSLPAQSVSTNYKLQAGNIVWGGGNSVAGELIITGSMPYQGAGHSSSKDRVITGGIISSLYSNGNTFLASYIGREIDTVSIVDRRMTVIFGGDTGTVTGTFNYRFGGREIYTTEPLLPYEGDTLIYNLSSDLVTLRGLEFYFKIFRGTKTVSLGDSAKPAIFITGVTNAQGQCPEVLPETTYAMISIPVDISSENEITDIFPDDLGRPDPTLWRLGHFDSEVDTVIEYPYAPDVIPGRAYWLIMRYPDSFGAAGLTVLPNLVYLGEYYYEMPLDYGWNQIANPFAFPINWDDVLFDYNGSIIGHDTLIVDYLAYLFTGTAYTSASVLQPWSGFFIFVKKSGVQILFPYHDALEVKKAASVELSQYESSAFDWALQLKLEACGFIDDGNLIGVRNDATTGPDWYDLADPPSPPGKPRLAFLLPDHERYLRRIDIRPPIKDGATWDIDILNTGGCRLTFSDLASLPENLQTRLVLDLGTVIPLENDTTVFIGNNIRGARLIIGNSNYLQKEIKSLLPGDYALYQNYPNPFNPETNIRFALPEAGRVTIDIFNVLGQRVTTLLDRNMPAGVNNVVWNGTAETGYNVATGIYFYRLIAGSFQQTKKMILLK